MVVCNTSATYTQHTYILFVAHLLQICKNGRVYIDEVLYEFSLPQEPGWTPVNIPTSMYRRIEKMLKRKFKGDYGKQKGVPEFVREALRNRLLELGAYDEDDDEAEDVSSNGD